MANINYFIEMVGVIVVLAIALTNAGGFASAIKAASSFGAGVNRTLQGRG